MIPQAAITEWNQFVPWPNEVQVEQDLIICKALTMANVNVENVIHCYREYMAFVVDHTPTYKEYVLNMEEKMKDTDFLGDTKNLLRLGDTFDPIHGYEIVKSTLIDRLQ